MLGLDCAPLVLVLTAVGPGPWIVPGRGNFLRFAEEVGR